MMSRGLVRKLVLAISNSGQGGGGRTAPPVERVIFDLGSEDNWKGQGGASALDEGRLQILEDHLRSALLKLQLVSNNLPHRAGCTFAIHLEAEDTGETEDTSKGDGTVRGALESGSWMLADDVVQVSSGPGPLVMVPIKSITGGGLELHLCAEMADHA
ncbi:unnamed protein product [Choristocarpus tenellus]